MATPTLKSLARSKKPKFGTFIVEFSTPGIGHIVKASGCEYVLYDMEHSGFGFETAKQAVRYFEAAGVAVIARVPSKDYDQIARIADMGAEGIMLPMVNNAAEARQILDCLKYIPDGKRGVALGVAHDNYTRTGVVADRLKAANKRTTLFCQIETAEGVENADAMAALDGVDCLWVGHFDLSCSLGIPGEFGHKNLQARSTKSLKPHANMAKPWGVLCLMSKLASNIINGALISFVTPAMCGSYKAHFQAALSNYVKFVWRKNKEHNDAKHISYRAFG